MTIVAWAIVMAVALFFNYALDDCDPSDDDD